MATAERRLPIRLLIFDCDGVLVDTERLGVRVEAEICTELGWPLTEAEVVERFLGRTNTFMISEIERELGRSLPNVWEEMFVPRYRAAFEGELLAVDGVVEALDRISITTCVASSGTHEGMRETLGRTGLYERFAGRIFSATEVEHGKPEPDLFLHAADRMGVRPEECAVVEDSIAGVQAARAAGMTVFAYGGGLVPARLLEGPNTFVFADMRELPDLLDRLATEAP
jgi:HAD superfamily hydrolase (TIGR01509 family)